MARAPQVNPTEFAILGLLAEQPRSGYDIKKEAEGRLSHFWRESYGHLYPMLRRLLARKLVSVRTVAHATGRPSRRVYSLTPAGRRALKAWFTEPPVRTRQRNELLLRIFLGRHAPPDALLRDVREYGERMRTSLEQLRAVQRAVDEEASDSPDAAYWRLVIDFGTRLYETLGEWSVAAEAEIEALARAR